MFMIRYDNTIKIQPENLQDSNSQLKHPRFRKAARESSLGFTDDEEDAIFKKLGRPIKRPGQTQETQLLHVFEFLEQVTGEERSMIHMDIS
jgi:hypothetical protein